jgi:hypothetical protein
MCTTTSYNVTPCDNICIPVPVPRATARCQGTMTAQFDCHFHANTRAWDVLWKPRIRQPTTPEEAAVVGLDSSVTHREMIRQALSQR